MTLWTDPSHWAVLFGTLTLGCWIGAGLAAVFGTSEEIHHSRTGKACELATRGLTVVGITSVVVMIALLLFL